MVKRVHFQGEYREILLAIDAYELSIYVGPERQVAVGERLFVRSKRGEVRVLTSSDTISCGC